MRAYFCATAGLVGGLIASLFGGWDISLQTLVLFMAIDYFSGLVVAGVFRKSPKTESGSLESRAGFKGLCRRCAVLCLVFMAHYLDLVIGADFARDAVCIGFIVNEGLSILENVGLMGITYPEVIKRALEVLSKKADGQNN
jgi:toxin secretion/phage lysis holin